ncbi:MAG: hypothetical protein NVS1B7_0070 [Candidatus Saccharimonadales bacterium]
MIREENGFTLPELLVVIIMTGFFVTLIFSFVFQYLQTGYISEASLDTLVSRLNVSDYLRESVGSSAGLMTQNSIPDSHTNAPDPAIASNLYWKPIHAIPGTTAMPPAGSFTPLAYYRRYVTTTTGAVAMNGNRPYEDEFVLYLDGTAKQLLVRTLANTTVTNNKATTSCPASQATSTCPADKVLARDVSSVDARYFSRTGNLIDYTSSTDPITLAYTGPDFPSVEALEYTLHFTIKPLFQQTAAVQTATVIRIALRNN